MKKKIDSSARAAGSSCTELGIYYFFLFSVCFCSSFLLRTSAGLEVSTSFFPPLRLSSSSSPNSAPLCFLSLVCSSNLQRWLGGGRDLPLTDHTASVLPGETEQQDGCAAHWRALVRHVGEVGNLSVSLRRGVGGVSHSLRGMCAAIGALCVVPFDKPSLRILLQRVAIRQMCKSALWSAADSLIMPSKSRLMRNYIRSVWGCTGSRFFSTCCHLHYLL